MMPRNANSFSRLADGAWWLRVGHVEPISARMPFAEYVQLPGLSISRLKEMKRSGQHCEYFARNPKRSQPLTLGSAAHCATLEPDRFAAAYRIWDRKTDSGRAAPRNGSAWDEFLAAAIADGCEVLTADEAGAALAIAAAVRSSKAAMRYLASGEPEVTMQWQMQGYACKGRVDWIATDCEHPVLVGLKTTRDCGPSFFGRQAADLSYECQWAWYQNGYYAITGIRPRVIEIVVENAAPNAVAVYNIPDEILLLGEENYGRFIEKFGECALSGKWPGPVPGEDDLTLPPWAYPPSDIDLGLES
jgi:hypothetical protein